jgi:uncharacterized peroxidase-related enzyme
MPHINTGNDFPGIVSLLMYDRGSGAALSALAQEMLRRPSTISTGHRELIAAYVSKLNNCAFCCTSHTACALELLSSEEEVAHGLDGVSLNMKLQAFLLIAKQVKECKRPAKSLVDQARLAGATDQEIHDVVLIAAMFCMFNRYVEGLDTTFNSIEEVNNDGRLLAKYGYKMSVSRLFGQIIPSMWKTWRTKFYSAKVKP